MASPEFPDHELPPIFDPSRVEDQSLMAKLDGFNKKAEAREHRKELVDFLKENPDYIGGVVGYLLSVAAYAATRNPVFVASAFPTALVGKWAGELMLFYNEREL